MNAMSRYNSKRTSQPLSEDEIRKYAPSIFADAAHDSRSARYTYIPTIDVFLQRSKPPKSQDKIPYAGKESHEETRALKAASKPKANEPKYDVNKPT